MKSTSKFCLSQFSEESNCWRSFFLEPLFGSAPRSIRNPRRPPDLEFNVYLAISVDPDNEMGTRLISYVRQRPKDHYESPLLSESGIQRLRVAVFGGSHFRRGVFWGLFGSPPPPPPPHPRHITQQRWFPDLKFHFYLCVLSWIPILRGHSQEYFRQRPSET